MKTTGGFLALLLALLSGTASVPAQTGPFAALAVSVVTGAYGAAWQHANQPAADRAAVQACSANARRVPDCRVVLSFQSGCAALAMDPRNAWYADQGASVTEAAAKALAACREAGKNCKIQKTLCAAG